MLSIDELPPILRFVRRRGRSAPFHRTIAVNAVVLAVILSLTATAISADALTADSKLGRRVDEMFQVGFARGPRAMEKTQQLCDTLRAESPNDPRIDYAQGIVLLKLLRNKEAKSAFQLATKRTGAPYLPAWQALIWSYFVVKEYDDGYDRVVEFSKLVEKSDGLTEDDRRACTYWIGHLMAAVEMTLDFPGRESWMQTEKRILGQTSERFVDAYNSGKEDVHARHMVLEDDIRQTREKEKERQAEIQGKKQVQVDKSLDAAKQKRDDLKKSAEDMKEEFEEQSANFKKQMERLEREYAMLERRSMSLMTQMLTLDQQINLFQNNRSSNSVSVQNLAAIQNRRAMADVEFQLTAAAAQQLSSRAQKMTEERSEFVAQYEKTTGDIVKEDAGVQKWKERTEKQADELKKSAKKPKPPAPALAAKIQAVTSFKTYLDLDLTLERDKVLQSYGIARDAK